MAKKDFVESAVDKAHREMVAKKSIEELNAEQSARAKAAKAANGGKYPYDTGRDDWTGKPRDDEFARAMKKYKDTPGDVHSDGTQDGSLGDGSETQLGKGAYHEGRKMPKDATDRDKRETATRYRQSAEQDFGRGGGYASRNQEDFADATEAEANSTSMKQGTSVMSKNANFMAKNKGEPLRRSELVAKYRKQR